jgi:hypothetical protein
MVKFYLLPPDAAGGLVNHQPLRQPARDRAKIDGSWSAASSAMPPAC